MALPRELIEHILKDSIELSPAENYDYFFRNRDERYRDAIRQLKHASLINKHWHTVVSRHLWRLALVELRSSRDLGELQRDWASVLPLIRHLHVVLDGSRQGISMRDFVWAFAQKKTASNLLSLRFTSFDRYVGFSEWDEIGFDQTHDCLSSLREVTLRFRAQFTNAHFLREFFDMMPRVHLLELAFFESVTLPAFLNDTIRLPYLHTLRLLVQNKSPNSVELIRELFHVRTLNSLKTLCLGRSHATEMHDEDYEDLAMLSSQFRLEQLVINATPRPLSRIHAGIVTWLASGDLPPYACEPSTGMNAMELRIWVLPSPKTLRTFLEPLNEASAPWIEETEDGLEVEEQQPRQVTIFHPVPRRQMNCAALQEVAAEARVRLKLVQYDQTSWPYDAE